MKKKSIEEMKFFPLLWENYLKKSDQGKGYAEIRAFYARSLSYSKKKKAYISLPIQQIGLIASYAIKAIENPKGKRDGIAPLHSRLAPHEREEIISLASYSFSIYGFYDKAIAETIKEARREFRQIKRREDLADRTARIFYSNSIPYQQRNRKEMRETFRDLRRALQFSFDVDQGRKRKGTFQNMLALLTILERTAFSLNFPLSPYERKVIDRLYGESDQKSKDGQRDLVRRFKEYARQGGFRSQGDKSELLEKYLRKD